MKVSFFCSSSEKLAPVFYSEAQLLGRYLGREGHELFYGASDMGLMKVVAQAAIGEGAKVVGVTTKSLASSYPATEGLADIIVCKNLAERKEKLVSFSDLSLVLPGGIGTLDECFEVLASKQIGEFASPVIFYNMFQFWSGLFSFLEQLREQNMIGQNLSEFYNSVNSVEELNVILQTIARCEK